MACLPLPHRSRAPDATRAHALPLFAAGASGPLNWNFALFDPMYPSRGVVLTYNGGESTFCPANAPRSFNLEIVCAPFVAKAPSDYLDVTCREANTCAYTVQLPNIAGCPTQCRAPSDGVVCTGHGVCGYNADAGRSQCYCFDGYAGALCAAAAPAPRMALETILLIVVCVILAAVLGTVAFMVVKLRRLNVNPARYGELQGKYNELGQMAL